MEDPLLDARSIVARCRVRAESVLLAASMTPSIAPEALSRRLCSRVRRAASPSVAFAMEGAVDVGSWLSRREELRRED